MKQTGNTLIIILAVAALVVGVVYYSKKDSFKNNQPSQQTNNVEPQIKEYQSKNLKIKIKVPNSLQMEEKFNRIVLTGADGLVVINSFGTNFEELEDYLEDLKMKNKSKIEIERKLTIDNYDAIKAKVNNETTYLIKVEDSVYAFSTESAALYDDLDQIAQSFEYTP